ncbi:MAG: TrkA family potassium uptake protein [Armatimonadota bacterium]|nr:TrkA family potassium uptake protein [Armatimonadota bacterium]MDR5703618.1 TrkA family potassium uptake protein [Armatimonadota bacterium]MDR7436041.1 TrkA family potassium uptake protein [Armatimonadota bacterium]
MKVIILGCGRLGALLAWMLSQEGHVVTIIDRNREAFRRLGEGFKGRTILGTGIDEDVLRLAGIEEADAFAAVTNGDNTNIMASQIAKLKFKVPKVIARVYDPLRACAYRDLGIPNISPTVLGAGLIRDYFLDQAWKTPEYYFTLIERFEEALFSESTEEGDQLCT